MKQRVVFVNLHASWMLLRNTEVIFFKTSAALKHKYLIDYLLCRSDVEVCSYINDRGFSLLRNGNTTIVWLLNLLRFWESRVILRKNGIDGKKITIIKDKKDIKPDDIVVLYNVLSNNYRGMECVPAFKVLSLLHFHGRKEESALINHVGVDCVFNEVDLRKTSELFRQYYKIDCPWIVIPFVFGGRFYSRVPFSERKCRCFATGTITYKEHEEFISVYHDSCDQPSRKFVKDNVQFFSGTVDCFCSDYLEDNPGKRYVEGENGLIRLGKKCYNLFHVGKQKKYFSFDMVQKFNEYKMHFVGEEVLGVPGIGFVEGMACGSAFIGIDSPMYRDMGLVPGVHYISYDGTKEGLRSVVEYFQQDEHQQELESIAKEGNRFVHENFNGEKVAQILYESILNVRVQSLL